MWLRAIIGFRFWLWLLVSSAFFWNFFVWLLVVLMVVESGFAVGGGDETGFRCGFHVFRVESRG